VHPRSTLIEKDTKSGTQPRLALDPETLALLVDHRAQVAEQGAEIGCDLSEDAYGFSLSPDGSKPDKPPSIRQRYRRLAAAQGLRSTRFHALRTTPRPSWWQPASTSGPSPVDLARAAAGRRRCASCGLGRGS